MAIDVDAVLIDRVFQPVSDAAARWATCFGLARGALMLAVEMQILVLFWDMVRDRSAFNVVLSGTAVALTILGAQQAFQVIMRAERQSRSGTVNLRRISLRPQRMTWLVVCIGCLAFLLPHAADVRASVSILACAAWVALIYFVSCTPRPPARRQSAGSTFATASA